MTKPPAFQFYASDFRADAKVLAMDFEQRGVYVWLLSIAWDEGGIPADPAHLARLLGITRRKLTALWPGIAPCFVREGDRLVSPLLRSRYVAAATRRRVFERDEFACRACGSRERLELDHIWPFCFGGSHTEDNLQVLCRDCNLAKGAQLPEGVA